MSTGQPSDPIIGRLVDGRYRVRARIARGGMATVYVATDLRLERRVALKVMHGHLTDDAVFQSRFIQEARSAARLANPHVVNVFDQGSDDGLAYLVMEYLPGITLRELMRDQRRLSIPQTITIMDAALSGLAAAHKAGIVHRDVKPENILLAEDGRIKIGDFGLARATTANTASGQMLLGTIAYLAPELVTRGTADARSDIYALGILLYEMLVGEQPYKGEQPMQIAYQHATDTVPRPSAKNPGVPEPLDELVLWATEREPGDRPDDAQVMLDRLREIERDLGVTPVATQATSAIPTIERGGSGELTRVLPTGAEVTGVTPVVTADVDNAARLRRRAAMRRARGAWLAIIVILVAAVAGGAAWWFNSGPGSLVAVPDVRSISEADATARLLQDTLIATGTDGQYSSDVAAGSVIDTDPRAGSRVDRESGVALILSLGPQPTTFDQALAGLPEDEARLLLENAGVSVGESTFQFSDDAGSGIVLLATATRPDGTAADLSPGGGTVYDGDSASLVVSVGSVPDVTGMSVDGATNALAEVDLIVADTAKDYSNDFDAGEVMGILPRSGGGPWVPGDELALHVSLGPAPIEIPSVADMTVREAVKTLEDAGFEPTTNVPSIVWDLFSVTNTSPAAGTFHVPGTEVAIRALG